MSIKQLYILSLSSNLHANIHMPLAIHALVSLGYRFEASPIMPFAAEDGISPSYLNAAALLYSTLSKHELTDKLKCLEHNFGRANHGKGLIAMDIDIVAYGDNLGSLQWQSNNSQLPVYVTQPLKQVLPNLQLGW